MNKDIAYNVMKPLVINYRKHHLVKERKTPRLLNERKGSKADKKKKKDLILLLTRSGVILATRKSNFQLQITN